MREAEQAILVVVGLVVVGVVTGALLGWALARLALRLVGWLVT